MSKFYQRTKQLIATALSQDTLKAKVFRGGAWMGGGSAAEQVIRFARNMALTRMLAPEAFGTMAIVLSAGSVIHTITDIGVKESIIQNPRGSEDQYVSAAWWLAFGRALSLYVFICLLAPWISRFYGNHELTPLLRVVAIGVILDGALSSKAYVALKQMKFGKWAVINHGGGIFGVILTLLLSLFLRDVWALVLGYLAESGARCALSFVLCPYAPSLTWDRDAARHLLQFSRGLFGLAFLNLIFARADIFVLAKLYPATQLGLYVMAIYLVQTPVSFLMNLLGQTLLPTLSHIQGNRERENRILIRVTSLIVLLGMPTLVFLFFCGQSLLTLFYGSRYSVATASLIVASCVALVNLLNGQITTVFYARGLPQLHRRCVAIMAIMMIVLTYPSVKLLGIVGAQVACLVSVVVGYLFQFVRVRQLTDLHPSQYLKSFLPSAALSSSVVVICLGTRLIATPAVPLLNVVFGIFGCLVAYGLAGVILVRGARGVA